jgi:hypothetical protein
MLNQKIQAKIGEIEKKQIEEIKSNPIKYSTFLIASSCAALEALGMNVEEVKNKLNKEEKELEERIIKELKLDERKMSEKESKNLLVKSFIAVLLLNNVIQKMNEIIQERIGQLSELKQNKREVEILKKNCEHIKEVAKELQKLLPKNNFYSIRI